MNIKRLLTYLPLAIPVIYIIGYIVTSSYLSRFGLNDNSFLNFGYLRSGVLFTFVLIILIWGVYIAFDKKSMTDNLEKSWRSHLLAFQNTLIITFLLSSPIFFELIDSNNKIINFIIELIFILFVLFNLIYTKKLDEYGNLKLSYLLPGIFSLVLLIVISGVTNPKIYILSFICVFISIITGITIGDFGDKNYKQQLLSNFICLFFTSYMFGYYIYKDVPSRFGGGKPYEIVISDLKTTNLIDSKVILLDTVSVVYENDVRILVVDKHKNILFINKNEIPVYKIINQ